MPVMKRFLVPFLTLLASAEPHTAEAPGLHRVLVRLAEANAPKNNKADLAGLLEWWGKT